jgi:hypothetical protein
MSHTLQPYCSRPLPRILLCNIVAFFPDLYYFRIVNAWKGHIAVLLLALMSVGIVPKSVWHACEHAHSAGHSGNAGHLQISGDCPICDYNFSAADLETAFLLEDKPQQSSVYSEIRSAFVFVPARVTWPLRGPPHC